MSAGRILRAVALVTLLFLPLVAAETGMHQSTRALYPLMKHPRKWADTKLMLIREAGCPQVLSMGTSITNRTLVATLIAGRSLPGKDGSPMVVRSVFAFGLNSSRATVMYAVWRQVLALGCVPKYLFVEVTPILMNYQRVFRSYFPPLLDLPTLLRMPPGFARENRFDLTELAEFITWDRLLVFRRRSEALKLAKVALTPGARIQREKRIPRDGRIEGLGVGGLVGERYQRERARRAFDRAGGRFRYWMSPVQRMALFNLAEQATQEGTRVILHTPPTTRIYREMMQEFDKEQDFCDLYRSVLMDGHEWHSYYGSKEFKGPHFTNWVHLSRPGGKLYATRLFEGIRTRNVRAMTGCI